MLAHNGHVSDDQPEPTVRDGHPIVWGLVAMIAVVAVVGGVLAGGVFVGTKALGLSDDPIATEESTARETMVVPDPTETDVSPTDYVTLRDVPEKPTPSSSFSETPDADGTITLEAGQSSVGAMETINLSGTYPDGSDGTALVVQRFDGGGWAPFPDAGSPITATVNSGDFGTFVLTGNIGDNRFRVIDPDADVESNEVVVTVG